MDLPVGFVPSNEPVDDSKIANQASLSQTQIIIIGGAGGGCLLIILGTSMSLQVNLCQKLLFLHKLTQNMMTDCSLFMKIVSSEYLQNMLCTQIIVFVLF